LQKAYSNFEIENEAEEERFESIAMYVVSFFSQLIRTCRFGGIVGDLDRWTEDVERGVDFVVKTATLMNV